MKDTLQLLRIPFSFFLMPVFFFALSQTAVIDWHKAIGLFLVLHLFIYPSSNAYNSYMDQDEGSIGGLKNPPKATRQLFYVSLGMDLIGLGLCYFIGISALIGIACYILASRLYSYRGVRLKKYPVIGFLTVVCFQGFLTFLICQLSFSNQPPDWGLALVAAFLIAGVYPLTQIYQHEADEKDGVKTISMLLGYKGTFVFTLGMFSLSASLLFYFFEAQNKMESFFIFTIFLLPTILYFLYWMRLVWKNSIHANFEHTMYMNVIASACMNGCFLLLTFLNP